MHLRLAATAEVVQRRPEALHRYARAVSLAVEPALLSSALLGRAHVNANGTDYTTALDELERAAKAANRVSDTRVRRRLLTRITNLRGRIHVMTDQEDVAARDYRESAELARRNDDLDGRVTALIFGSDVLHSRGHYVQALRRLAKTMDDNTLYSRPQTRVWGNFYRSLVLCSTGRSDEGLEDLRACRDAAVHTGNHQAAAWSDVALASYLKATDQVAASRHLVACRDGIRAHGAPMTVCEVRLEWEHAELSRAQGRPDEALRRIDALEARITDPNFGIAIPYMTPHLLAVRAEIARDGGDGDAGRLLREARDRFRTGKWRHSAVRMEVALWLNEGAPDPPIGLLDRCRRYDYGSEVDRLLGNATGYYPLHSW
ncbi:hypothetical protein [Saccharothrix stipae]